MLEIIGGIPQGIISLYSIPNEWAEDDDLFKAMWLPEQEWRDGKGWVTVREAAISDEAKASRLVCEPRHNLMTNTGIALYLTNQSVTTQAAMFPFYQITAIGNGAFSGPTRGMSTLPGDGFASGSRKAPASFVQSGFSTTIITNFGSGDAVGTWSCASSWGYSVAHSQNASTTTNTGNMQSIAGFPFSKASGFSYSFNYVFVLSN